MEDGVQWHQGIVTWVLEVCTEAQTYSGNFCTRPTVQNVQDSQIICPKWIPCFLWKQLPGFSLTWLFWGFFLGLLREPGCEQGCVQHGAPTAGNTGTMGSQGAHDQGWLHQPESRHNFICQWRSFSWWLFSRLASSGFIPCPFRSTSHAGCLPYTCETCFPKITELLSELVLSPHPQGLRVAFSAPTSSALKHPAWDDVSNAFPNLLDTSPPFFVALRSAPSCCFDQLRFPSPTLTWGSDSELCRSYIFQAHPKSGASWCKSLTTQENLKGPSVLWTRVNRGSGRKN